MNAMKDFFQFNHNEEATMVICLALLLISLLIIARLRHVYPPEHDINVFFHPGGPIYEDDDHSMGWYFWDETGDIGGGPYMSYRKAQQELTEYARQL